MSLLVPEGTLLVHIGPQKTGSSALQHALHGARDLLEQHGSTTPGRVSAPRKAAWALGLPGRHKGSAIPGIAPWERLVREVEGSGAQRVCQQRGSRPVTARAGAQDRFHRCTVARGAGPAHALTADRVTAVGAALDSTS